MATTEGRVFLSGEESESSSSTEEVKEDEDAEMKESDSRGKGEEAKDAVKTEDASRASSPRNKDDPEPWVPDRVQEVLNKAETFEEYKGARVFRYLHLFSGPKDVLGKELKEEAKKCGLQVMVLSLDRKKDDSIDLGDPSNHEMIKKEIQQGMWDGTHSGFPCGSFSRARHNKVEGLPGPVRDARHIYGLPTNDKKGQEEADRGTLLATHAGWLHQEQVKSAKRRMVPAVSTLENPPGDEVAGSAWLLPEMQDALSSTNAYTVQFNTCAFQTKCKERWFKPAQWSGRLEGMEKLCRKCDCPGWIKHVTLSGKARTEAAGEYPEELAAEVAKLVVLTWKRVAGLEFWRHKVATREQEVSVHSKIWLAAERTRTSPTNKKRSWMVAFDEKTGSEKAPRMSEPEKREEPKKSAESLAFDGADNPNNYMPSSSHKTSKKEKREEQNDFSIGGMRHPKKAVDRLHLVKSCGMHIRNQWELFYLRNPEAKRVARDYGSEKAEVDEEVLQAWTAQLEEVLGVVKEKEREVVKLAYEFRSPLKAHLWEAWQKKAKDPDEHLVNFIRRGVPLGMSLPVPPSGGVFPPADPNKRNRFEEDVEFEDARGTRNYSSVTTQQGEAAIEIDRYLAKNFVRRMTWDEISKLFGSGTVSKMALILKQKPDGTTKRRIILDLRRSGGNDKCEVEERITLPRLSDVLEMMRSLKAKEGDLKNFLEDYEYKRTRRDVDDQGIEFVLADMQDAFCHFGVHPKELRNCISPDESGKGALLWTAMLFGFKAAPLLMGRLAAACGRLTQSLFYGFEVQSQIYMDDLLYAVKGPVRHREKLISLMIYTLRAMGVQLSLGKGERGTRIQWIGALIELRENTLTLGIPAKMAREVLDTLVEWKSKGMVSAREWQALTGRLSWMAGVVRRIRWCVAVFYAILTEALRDEESGAEQQRAAKREDQRPKVGLIAVKRLGVVLPWLIRALQNPEEKLAKHEKLVRENPKFMMITDACPRGIGGILVKRHQDGTSSIVSAYEAIVAKGNAQWLMLEHGQPSSQGPLEALAIWRGLQHWKNKLAGAPLLIRSDSVVALSMVQKLSSKSVSLNYIAAELSALLEDLQIPEVVSHHIRGKENLEADWLSRIADRGECPASLRGVPMMRLGCLSRDETFFDPPGKEGSEWAKCDGYAEPILRCL